MDFSFLVDHQQPSVDPLALSSTMSARDETVSSVHETVPSSDQSTIHSKRTFSHVDVREPPRQFTDEARSVANDLGMLTLNSDSRQTHYLGSSSGRLFTSLMGMPQTPSSTGTSATTPPTSSASVKSRLFSYSKSVKESYRNLYALLRRVGKALSCIQRL